MATAIAAMAGTAAVLTKSEPTQQVTGRPSARPADNVPKLGRPTLALHCTLHTRYRNVREKGTEVSANKYHEHEQY